MNRRAVFRDQGPAVIGETHTGVAHSRSQVAQHRSLAIRSVERTSRWEQRKVRLDGALDLVTGAPNQSPIAHVVAVFAPDLPTKSRTVRTRFPRPSAALFPVAGEIPWRFRSVAA